MTQLDAIETEIGPESPRPTRVRFLVLASACVLAVITYLHRVGFAVASAEFRGPLGLDDSDIGTLSAAFMIAYGLFEVPWGLFSDRNGVRKPLAIVAVGGSVVTAGIALAAVLPVGSWMVMTLLVPLRFLFGMFQAGTFPSVSRMMADWMPSTERGFAQGLIWMSSRTGGALAPLILVPLFAKFGNWPAPLLLLAGLGLVWTALFVPWFRDSPEHMPSVNVSESKIILGGRAGRSAPEDETPWRAMLHSRSAWALCIAYGTLGYSGNFFLSLLPTYLRTHRGFDKPTCMWLQALPFACGIASCLFGGWLSDAILRRTGNRRWGRRLVGAIGLGVASLAILATLRVESPLALGILLCLTFAGNDFAMAPAWAAAADIGERHTGTLAGLMNMTASFTGALMAVVTSRFLSAGDRTTPFLIFSAVYLLGVFAWLAVDASKPLTRVR
jgi:ACS family glucarate transporter-like MFS transporter